MPTVLRIHGFDVQIYTRDHEPPHVHCWKGNAELVIDLDPISIRENNGMKKGDARQALAIMVAHQQFLLTEWNKVHP